MDLVRRIAGGPHGRRLAIAALATLSALAALPAAAGAHGPIAPVASSYLAKPGWRRVLATALASAVLALMGCGSSGSPAGYAPPARPLAGSALPATLLAQARPIGHGARFHRPATG